jgi:pyruvate dehydrogenase E1 component alpha subunit
MFESFDPREGKRIRLLDPSGMLKACAPELPILSDGQALEGYRAMVLARQADEWAVSLNRQGRMPTYALNKGQEANSAGALLAVNREDWFVPAYRELAGMLIRGVPLDRIFLYWYGSEEGSRLPREAFHMMPLAVSVGSQPLHAVGISYAERYLGTGRIAITFMGEGATSEGDFHEACNLAGVWKAGVIFYVQNNQWAISLPRHKQTASATVAEKAFAYGFEGVQVDGNDIFAVYAAVSMAAKKAREGGGPTLIEGYTYRLGAHTTSDDPTRYRADEEVQEWVPLDPLTRLERYMISRGLISDREIQRIGEESLAAARHAFEEVERSTDPPFEDIFRYLYETMPDPLAAQLESRKRG